MSGTRIKVFRGRNGGKVNVEKKGKKRREKREIRVKREQVPLSLCFPVDCQKKVNKNN